MQYDILMEKEMKAEHRHELKTNELAEWITQFPQWAKRNLKSITYVAVLVVVVVGVYIYNWHEKNVVLVQREIELTKQLARVSNQKTQIIQAQAQGVDTSYTLLDTAKNLQVIGENEKNNQMAALALIKQAEALRMELHYRPGTVSRRDIEERIKQAKACYTKAIEKAASNPSFMATATLGLGLCEEEVGNFEKAKQVYLEITANSDLEGTVAVEQAKRRLETMADYKQKVAFKPPPKPATPKPAADEPAQPQIQLNPAAIVSPNQ
jgi:tetratricopeptide (TPR) repeat protein